MEQALSDALGDSPPHRAFKAAVLSDWRQSRIPLDDAVQNDLFICLFSSFLSDSRC